MPLTALLRPLHLAFDHLGTQLKRRLIGQVRVALAHGADQLRRILGLAGFFSVAIMLSLLIFIGEAVRDAFDPRKTFR